MDQDEASGATDSFHFKGPLQTSRQEVMGDIGFFQNIEAFLSAVNNYSAREAMGALRAVLDLVPYFGIRCPDQVHTAV